MPPKRARHTKPELLNIWKKVDTKNNGYVTLEEVLARSRLLQEECPEIIDNWASIAKDAKLTRQSFVDFYLRPGTGGRKGDAETEVDLQVDLNELRKLFDKIVPERDGKQELRVSDLVAHKAELERVFPGITKRFVEGDLSGSSTLSWDELRILASGTDEWLEYQFDRIIGLHTLKDQLRQFHRSVVLDKKRSQAGHDVKTGGKFHMIFQGNPGTGKTTVARLVAQLMHRIGIIASDLLVEVQRDKLVAEYVGQTGPKTQAVIEEAKSGVLFIDEAYRLSQSGGGKDFGREAIEQLMGAMNEPPGKAPVMVFAGYPDDMEAFMTANSGLYRRIAYTFDFTDYDPVDLAQILELTAQGAGFSLEPNLAGAAGRDRLATLIEENTLPDARALMNGGLCERIFTFSKQSLDDREARKTRDEPISVELTEADILGACKRIPPPPPREGSTKIGGDAGGGTGGSADGGSGGSPALLAPQIEAAQRRAERAEARCLELEAEAARLKAEVQVLRQASAATAGGADKMAEFQKEQIQKLAAAEGRACKAEAQLTVVQGQLDRAKAEAAQAKKDLAAAHGAPSSVDPSDPAAAPHISVAPGTRPPPEKYEILPCLKYSFGCLMYFTVVLCLFLWKWTKIICRWLRKNFLMLVDMLRGTNGAKDSKVTPSAAAPAAPSATGPGTAGP